MLGLLFNIFVNFNLLFPSFGREPRRSLKTLQNQVLNTMEMYLTKGMDKGQRGDRGLRRKRKEQGEEGGYLS